jgi:hypothetical protein
VAYKLFGCNHGKIQAIIHQKPKAEFNYRLNTQTALNKGRGVTTEQQKPTIYRESTKHSHPQKQLQAKPTQNTTTPQATQPKTNKHTNPTTSILQPLSL